MRSLEVFRNHELAGILTEESPDSYHFKYIDHYFNDPEKPAISLTLPKKSQEYFSACLFPFFFSLLSEGANRQLQNQVLKIEEKDYFGLLAATGQYDTIGAVTVKPVQI